MSTGQYGQYILHCHCVEAKKGVVLACCLARKTHTFVFDVSTSVSVRNVCFRFRNSITHCYIYLPYAFVATSLKYIFTIFDNNAERC